jgi:hypothetical protein
MRVQPHIAQILHRDGQHNTNSAIIQHKLKQRKTPPQPTTNTNRAMTSFVDTNKPNAQERPFPNWEPNPEEPRWQTRVVPHAEVEGDCGEDRK